MLSKHKNQYLFCCFGTACNLCSELQMLLFQCLPLLIQLLVCLQGFSHFGGNIWDTLLYQLAELLTGGFDFDAEAVESGGRAEKKVFFEIHIATSFLSIMAICNFYDSRF